MLLPEELIPYAALLYRGFRKSEYGKLLLGELDKELNIHTGGFNAFTMNFFENQDDKNFIAKFVINSKAMNLKLDKLFGLTDEIVIHPD